MSNNVVSDNGVSGIVVQTGDNEVRAWTSDVTITGGTVMARARMASTHITRGRLPSQACLWSTTALTV